MVSTTLLYLLPTLVPFCVAVTNPISVASAIVLGNQTSDNAPGTTRDGGWESQIGSTYFQFYADTTVCDPNNAADNCVFIAANSLAFSTSNPLSVTDFATPHPPNICASPISGYRLHLTNVVSLSDTQGFAYYQNISSSTSEDIDGNTVGSGVATITYSGSGTPTCSVSPQLWGTAEPLWGSGGAIGKNLDGYIYVLGSVGDGGDQNTYADVFCARVAPGSQGILSAYQYWDGTAWSATSLVDPVFEGFAPAAVLSSAPQGSIVYNNHYNTYMYIYPGATLSGQILGATAAAPNGPWSSPVLLYQGSELLYAPVAQSHFDTTGKTLIFQTAVFSPIYLLTVEVTFN